MAADCFHKVIKSIDTDLNVCYDASNILELPMSQQTHHQLNQSQVKVAQQAQDTAPVQVWLAALAFFFAGVFYFYSYYFWGTGGAALTGG